MLRSGVVSLSLECRMAGRKPFTPTDEQRRMVPQDDIALVVRCSPPTRRKCFRQELDVATIEANARVAQTLYQQATTPGNIAATIFWLKARAGWREKQTVEVTGKDDPSSALRVVVIKRFEGDEPPPAPPLLLKAHRHE